MHRGVLKLKMCSSILGSKCVPYLYPLSELQSFPSPSLTCREAKVPSPPPEEHWKEVHHDNKVPIDYLPFALLHYCLSILPLLPFPHSDCSPPPPLLSLPSPPLPPYLLVFSVTPPPLPPYLLVFSPPLPPGILFSLTSLFPLPSFLPSQVTWLASWTENIQGSIKYVMLNPTSRLKVSLPHTLGPVIGTIM